jgi:comEA protein
MKKLVLAVALWFAAAGVAGRAIAADTATTATKAPADTKAVAKDAAKPKLMVNINKASKDELKALKGIGDTRAQDIIDYRTKNGDFKTIDDLEKVKGVGPGTMKQIRANISVSGETMIPKKAEAAAKDAKPAATTTAKSTTK